MRTKAIIQNSSSCPSASRQSKEYFIKQREETDENRF